MRRRRAGLQVSTFPFLAVLLCAMGSLILLLLVIDRRAKIVARNKALEAQELARLLDDTEMKKRREEWERQRRALHALLASQHDQLKTQLKNLQSQTVVAAENLRLEHTRHLSAEQALARGKSDLELLRAGMARWRDAIAQSKREGEKANAIQQQAIQQLTGELIDLERTLEALRILRRRQEQAFSLVPYGGKRGDSRKPVYVECNRSGLTFYPQARTIPDHAIGLAAIRAEVDKRAETKGRAYLLFLVRPDGITAYTVAQGALRGGNMDFGYELVEPDWEFDFGSEDRLVAQPWQTPQVQAGIGPVGSSNARPRSAPPPLMFNHGGLPGAQPGNGATPEVGVPTGPGLGFDGRVNGNGGNQPGMYIGFGNNTKPGVGAFAPSTGAPTGPGLGFDGGGNGNGAGGNQPGFGSSAKPGVGAFASSNGAATGPGLGFDGGGNGFGASGNQPGFGNSAKPGVGAFASSNGAPTGPGIGFDGGGNGFGAGGNQPGSGPGSVAKPGSGSPWTSPGSEHNGSDNVGAGALGGHGLPGGQGSEATGPWRSTRGCPGPTSAQPGVGQGGNVHPGGQSGGPSIGIGNPSRLAQGPNAGGSESSEPAALARTDAASAQRAIQGSPSAWQGRPSVMEPATSPPAGMAASQTSPSELGGNPPDDAPPSIGLPPPPDAEPGEGPGLPYLGGPRFGAPKPKTRPVVPLSRMLGNRDYPIVLECTEEAIIIQPWGIRYENSGLPRRPDPNHALVQTMNKLIARRQATVRQGEPPYRPVLRFQIRPGGLRSFYLAYPMLELLHLPMTRENVQEEVELRR